MRGIATPENMGLQRATLMSAVRSTADVVATWPGSPLLAISGSWRLRHCSTIPTEFWHIAMPVVGAVHCITNGHARMGAIVLPNIQNQY